MARSTHKEIIEKILSVPENKKEYDNLEEEFSFYREILKARLDSGKTQEEIAEKMNTTKSAVSRFENSGGKKKHSPTLETLRKYAKALDCELRIQFISRSKRKQSKKAT